MILKRKVYTHLCRQSWPHSQVLTIFQKICNKEKIHEYIDATDQLETNAYNIKITTSTVKRSIISLTPPTCVTLGVNVTHVGVVYVMRHSCWMPRDLILTNGTACYTTTITITHFVTQESNNMPNKHVQHGYLLTSKGKQAGCAGTKLHKNCCYELRLFWS